MEFDVASVSTPFHNPEIIGVEFANAVTLLWFKCDDLAITARWSRRSLHNSIHHTILIFIHDGADFSSCRECGVKAA